jgi:hypothetical protein
MMRLRCTLTLMLRVNAKPVDYDGLQALTTPEATASSTTQ